MSPPNDQATVKKNTLTTVKIPQAAGPVGNPVSLPGNKMEEADVCNRSRSWNKGWRSVRLPLLDYQYSHRIHYSLLVRSPNGLFVIILSPLSRPKIDNYQQLR